MSVLPLKRLVDPARPITYGIVQAGPDTEGGVPYIRPVDMVEHVGVPDPSLLLRTTREIAMTYQRSIVRPGDIVVSIGPSFGKTMIVPPELDGANLTQGTARVAVGGGADRNFLRWALQSTLAVDHWNGAVGGATFRALNLEPLARTPIPVLPIERQRAIADYLDRETARIDALIAAKKRMVELLQERWAAEVSDVMFPPWVADHVLSGGPGVDDAEWKLEKLLWLTNRRFPIAYGILLPGERLPEGVPYLGAGDVRPGRMNLAELPRTTQEIAAAYPRTRLSPGDLVYAIRGSFGAIEEVPPELDGANLSRDVARIVPGQSIAGRWLMYALKSELAQEQFRRREIGATITGINIEDLKTVRLAVPNLGEQMRAVQLLDDARSRHEQMLAVHRRQISLLTEHRQTLITAAVTGELDISEAA